MMKNISIFRSTHLMAIAEAPSEGVSSTTDITKLSSVPMLKEETLLLAPHATPRSGAKSMDRGVMSSILIELKDLKIISILPNLFEVFFLPQHADISPLDGQ